MSHNLLIEKFWYGGNKKSPGSDFKLIILLIKLALVLLIYIKQFYRNNHYHQLESLF